MTRQARQAPPTIVLGVSGSIAAYKAAELTRLLIKDGCRVRVVMTRAATQFISPLTLQVLSGNKVMVHLFEGDAGVESWSSEDANPDAGPAFTDEGVEHIDVVKEADLVVVAPATADLLAKAAHGLGDDALSTVLLAAGTNVLFAPAMNHRMWNHPATRANVDLLRRRGCRFVEPGLGYQACREEGVGRLADPAEILAAIRAELARSADLRGLRIVVTSGRTEEPVDPVRVLTNRSSGRMGVALAEEARDRGAIVTLVAGVLSVPAPPGVRVIAATTAEAMHAEVLAQMEDADVLVMAAAVADFRPARPATRKIKKGDGLSAIELEPTVDILKAVAAVRRPGQLLVGFALETNDGLAGAMAKLTGKGLDLLALNNPLDAGSEFGGATNRVTLLRPGQAPEELPLLSKREVARVMLDHVRDRRGGAGA